MPPEQSVLPELQAARRLFLELVTAIRPDLHRYCARMIGSVADGEDIVQDTLARAYFELSELREIPALRPWLFRIAHNCALDHLRRYEVRMSESLDVLGEGEVDTAADPDAVVARDEAVQAAVSRFLELPPQQRSCVILKDVLGCSLEELCEYLQLSVPAVKSALHRGRTRLHEWVQQPQPLSRRTNSPAIARYAALFNEHNWDGVRAMLAEDVQLELVSMARRSGRKNVGNYFSNYEKFADWRMAPAWLDGREVIAVFRGTDAAPRSFIELTLRDTEVVRIRDFHHVPYIARDAQIEVG